MPLFHGRSIIKIKDLSDRQKCENKIANCVTTVHVCICTYRCISISFSFQSVPSQLVPSNARSSLGSRDRTSLRPTDRCSSKALRCIQASCRASPKSAHPRFCNSSPRSKAPSPPPPLHRRQSRRITVIALVIQFGYVIKRSASLSLAFAKSNEFICLFIAAVSQHGGAQRRDEESRRTHEGPQLDISAVDVVAVPVLKK